MKISLADVLKKVQAALVPLRSSLKSQESPFITVTIISAKSGIVMESYGFFVLSNEFEIPTNSLRPQALLAGCMSATARMLPEFPQANQKVLREANGQTSGWWLNREQIVIVSVRANPEDAQKICQVIFDKLLS